MTMYPSPPRPAGAASPRTRARSRFGSGYLLAASLALASCSSDRLTGPSDVTGEPWKLRSMEIPGEPTFTPPDPSRFTVRFESNGHVGVVADCNQCGGTWSLDEHRLIVSTLACTRVACPTPHGDRFAGLIDGASTVDLEDGELEIESARGRIRLRR